MQWVIPAQTDVWVMPKEDDKVITLLSEMLGQDPHGIRLTLPKFLTQVHLIPARTRVACTFVRGQSRYRFESYVKGYLNAAPPCMIIASPDIIHSGEMRTAMRYAVQVPAFYISDDEKAKSGYTQSVNLSMNGLQMITHQSLEPNTPLFIQIYLPEGTVSVMARVVWSSYRDGKFHSGVNFVSMNGQSALRLHKFFYSLEKSAGQRPGETNISSSGAGTQ